MDKNLYTNTARFYDKGNEIINYDYDIDFYKSFVDLNTNVLELGCGTGRITLSLLDKCKHITGIELSKQMLGILQDKVNKLDKEQQNKIDLYNVDMSKFDLNQEFDLIIFPGITFQALTTIEQREYCLECAKKHLSQNGKIIIDLLKPDYNKVDNVGKTRLNYEYFDDEIGCIIKKYSVIEKHDREKQLHYMKYTFQLCKSNIVVEVIEDSFELSYLYEEQARALFVYSGLNVDSLYSWYDFTNGDKENKQMLIYVLSKGNDN